ncbi:hypothetical protein LILAB_05700 [Corallococcus macrosporus]|uniref:Uncharacterized protein n=1 Tax=Myxococcus fulvus (strain ATCC BAA-855 / HW-1) TaxID=483219 RepID=F8CR17_MYXFH|nr:hypothetical protein LILAB_05700 [Corallococcus macrosporus]
MNSDTAAPGGMYGQRPSKSAEWARKLHFERMAEMSPRERVLLALSLKERSRLIQERVALLQSGAPTCGD